MIRELLRPEKIIVRPGGVFPDALLERSSFRERRAEVVAQLEDQSAHGYLFLGKDVAIPHVRLQGLRAPEIILAISPAGIALDGKSARIVLLLATPADMAAQHLQLLGRLSSVLPATAEALLRARDAERVLKIIATEEERPGRATYINLTQEQVAFELHTDLQKGLTREEAARRLLLHGPNRLTRARRAPWLLRLLRNLFSFFATLLWIAALLCFVPGVDMPQLGIAILVVVLVNGVFAFLQEEKADRAVETLEAMLSPKARVLRDGAVTEVDAATLVPGDVIALEAGDVVPADARLIEAVEVEVDNSTLTGESTSARRYKSDQPILIAGKFLWIELPNIVFAGTALLKGEARAVVFGTGMSSEIGKIAGLTAEIRTEESPLERELRSAVFTIAAIACGLGVTFLAAGYFLAGLTFVQAFIFFIGLFVANVPEGLLPTVTLALAMGVTRMAKRNALLKSLPAVETLGCTTVICCDKTGTLTENRMRVSQIYVDGRTVTASGSGYAPEGELMVDGRRLSGEDLSRWPALKRLIECARLCNNARLERSGSDCRVLGDPTEGALLALAEKAHLSAAATRLAVHPFESVRKRMSVVVRLDAERKTLVFSKGAPLETLERCDRVFWEGEVKPLDEAHRLRITAENDALATRGLRLLALAFREAGALSSSAARTPVSRGASATALSPPADGGGAPSPPNVGPHELIEVLESAETDRVEQGLIFLGLVAISDPVRPEVPNAIEACHKAGIRVIMITGDYALTATTIGREIGLGGGKPLVVRTGAELSDLSDSDLRPLLARGEAVFARVSPEHKLRIVSLLKDMGEIVAVTGDGVNDAPALKKAHIGIAMGLRGNDVAKEAADVILADDNFSTIVAAIEEGRAIFDNIRRFVAYVLNSNPQEMYPYILWVLFPGAPLAMTVMGVLAVDVGTDLIPAMGLGVEPPEPGIMARPPRRAGEKLLSLGLVLRSYFVQGSLLALSCYATYLYLGWTLGSWRPGLPLSSMPASPAGLRMGDASTAYLMSLTAYFFPTVTTQIANVLEKRSWSSSLFSRDFLSPERRRDVLAGWRPGCAKFLERHPILVNLFANPLINLGIVFELVLCVVFFYSPLAGIYYFAPVPWHVYLFAFHGTVLLLAFEETKKLFRRRGYALDFLG